MTNHPIFIETFHQHKCWFYNGTRGNFKGSIKLLSRKDEHCGNLCGKGWDISVIIENSDLLVALDEKITKTSGMHGYLDDLDVCTKPHDNIPYFLKFH